MFLTAGPGSGKTRVLLWRTLNLIVFNNVLPESIFLSTFTEKAAFQLQQGLRVLLGIASNHTKRSYDISKMYIGTVHSSCQQFLLDRRFASDRRRGVIPAVLDGVGQYFFVYRRRNWDRLRVESGMDKNETITEFFEGRPSKSRHRAVQNAIAFFNRLTEECIDPEEAAKHTRDSQLKKMLRMYSIYRSLLQIDDQRQYVDLSMLQQRAYERLQQSETARNAFRHVIVDEYQDTNPVQERLFFLLAQSCKNICVVGDDDQALYRFRGATVENFVNFSARCKEQLQTEPKRIPLEINFRSRKRIVNCYTAFIQTCDWRRKGGGHYRVAAKNITAYSVDDGPSVLVSDTASPDDVAVQIAKSAKQLIESKKISDPNQIAFLFPTLDSKMVETMMDALDREGLKVYAPRAGRFLDVPESLATFGVLSKVFGLPPSTHYPGADWQNFGEWKERCEKLAEALMREDSKLREFITLRRQELKTITKDYGLLLAACERNNWALDSRIELGIRKALSQISGLSQNASATLRSKYMERIIQEREQNGRPFTVQYVLTTATSVDWSVLDLFYQTMGFSHFREMFDKAEDGTDEGPICNLALITKYLARFMDEYSPMITGRFLADGMFTKLFFGSYLYALYRLGESEYEDADDPFPRGRIPFLTIHQAKGLEFPVVVLGSPRKNDRGAQSVEKIVRPLLKREAEPIDRCTEFDIMRMFYVALSRAQNLLILAHPRGRGISTHNGIEQIIESHATQLTAIEVENTPTAKKQSDELPKSYSYTSDYLQYQKCARQYMIFRKYGFVASRSQTEFFGSLVHKTIEDLHHLLIAQRTKGASA